MAEAAVTGRISAEAQRSLVQYCKIVLDLHHKTAELREKMEFIDIAYARYKYGQQNTGNGEDVAAAETPCGVDVDDITVPIVVSQVDSYVGYFADIFLSGFPIFPVVSTVDNMVESEKLQSIVDDHAIRGRYPRHLLMSLRDDTKYNFSALEIDWCPLDLYSSMSSYEQVQAGQASKLAANVYYINKLKRLDPYNVIYDDRVQPVDVPYHGEYAGYIELISRVELKRRLAYFATTGDGYHTSQSLTSKLGQSAATASAAHLGYYTQAPQISNIIVRKDIAHGGLMDWVAYLSNQKANNQRYANMSDMYEFVTLYVRLIPEEHSMGDVPKRGTPQVWKLCFVNHEKLVYAKRIYSLYDMLPVIISQPFEDGFGTQTESMGERGIPFQDAASKLFAIRLNSARRAVMDRALYDPAVINKDDINAPFPAAKIPIKANSLLGGKTLTDSYKQIPFDSRGTETVIQDMRNVVQMADVVNGLNQPNQGQFQKGNKTRKEWNDTMGNADKRLRLPALALEYQKFLPIKEQIKLNIYQYGVEGPFQNMRSGEIYQITPKELQSIKAKIGNFELADGFHPVEKMAASDVLTGGMQLIGQSQVLQAAWGPALPRMFAHLMSLGGVKGIDKYLPPAEAPAQAGAAPPPTPKP